MFIPIKRGEIGVCKYFLDPTQKNVGDNYNSDFTALVLTNTSHLINFDCVINCEVLIVAAQLLNYKITQ